MTHLEEKELINDINIMTHLEEKELINKTVEIISEKLLNEFPYRKLIYTQKIELSIILMNFLIKHQQDYKK